MSSASRASSSGGVALAEIKSPLLGDDSSSSGGGGGGGGADAPLFPKGAITGNQLGLFFGVYVPCILNIFGVVIFIRFGWIIGQFGLVLSLGVYAGAYLAIIMTVFSISAIATNGRIRGGGAYYLISRALGPEFGAGIGVVFYLAQVVGAGFYISSFAEVVYSLLPAGFNAVPEQWMNVAVASAVLFFLFILTLLGAQVFAKLNLVFFILMLGVQVVCAASMIFMPEGIPVTVGNNVTQYDFTRPSTATLAENILPQINNTDFGTVFAGDLKDPAHAIPKGTLLAVATTAGVYFVFSFLFASSVRRSRLQNDYLVLQKIAVQGWIVVVGEIAAALSSGLGSLIGGSRILQALARDRLLPLGWFAHGSGAGDEPRRAALLTWILTQCVLFIPSLNQVANYTTMFFLLSYIVVNLACFLLSVTGAPNFRPSWRMYGWGTAVIGSIICAGAMFYMNPVGAAVSVALFMALFIYVMFRGPAVNWGDISQALIYHQVRKFLLRLDPRRSHVKYWRPQVLLLVKNPGSALSLIEVADSVKKGGLFVIGNIIPGAGRDVLLRCQQNLDAWMELIREMKIKAFPEVVPAANVCDGVKMLMLSAGLGGMKPNTVILNWIESGADRNRSSTVLPAHMTLPKSITQFPSQPDLSDEENLNADGFVSVIRDGLACGKIMIVSRDFHRFDRRALVEAGKRGRQPRFIDVWAIQDVRSEAVASSTLLLADLVSRTGAWKKGSTVRVFGVSTSPQTAEETRTELRELLMRLRFRFEVVVVPMTDSDHYTSVVQPRDSAAGIAARPIHALDPLDRARVINDLVRLDTAATALVFLGTNTEDDESGDSYVQRIGVMSSRLPPVLLVHSPVSVLTDEI